MLPPFFTCVNNGYWIRGEKVEVWVESSGIVVMKERSYTSTPTDVYVPVTDQGKLGEDYLL